MIGQFFLSGQTVRVDFSQGMCIAIPLNFAGVQPSHFDAAPARAEPMAVGGFMGDTRQGGSCNVPILTINPHCNGTHTETVAHIVDDPVAVHGALSGGLIPSTLITVTPIPAPGCGESYRPALVESDAVITANALAQALHGQFDPWMQAVVIRTRPNHEDKPRRRYGTGFFPPFLTLEAADFLASLSIRHLLIDIPSVDKMYDDGLLTVHHRFWNVPEGTHILTADSRMDRTITEMIYVPEAVTDGRYLLDLQIPAFLTDVAPSRPWLYPVEFN